MVSPTFPETESTSATHKGVILALSSKIRSKGTGRPCGLSTREKTSRYCLPSFTAQYPDGSPSVVLLETRTTNRLTQ